MVNYQDIEEAKKTIFKIKCSRCGDAINGHPMGIWDEKIQLKFRCHSCGTVREYVNVDSSLITKEKM